MRLRRCRPAAVMPFFSVATALSTMPTVTPTATLALANAVDPLGYSGVRDFFPIEQRAVVCPADYFSCEDKGPQFKGACCETGQVCSLDAYQSAACCPTSATCTGVAPGGGPTAMPSYISNPYFTFPVIPTSFSNVAACTTALRDCSGNYNACLKDLGGGGTGAGYGVTIQVPGVGGTTVAQAQTTLAAATATSVCSSLSLAACHGLSNGLCSAGTQGGFTIGSANSAPRPTAACMAGVLAGVGLGIVGAQL